jgi:hypothetical protein
MKKQVILFSSHLFNDFIIEQYNKLRKAAKDNTDLFLLIEYEKDSFTIPDSIKYFPFDVETLNNLKYEPIAETIIPGSNHFQVFQFYKTYPQYEYYWNIEYDVYFNGEWNILFDTFKLIDSDFISSHLERFHQSPNWAWWKSLRLKTIDIPETEYVKSFNPIYRISNKAMAVLDKILLEGNSGHHEVLIPTVLNFLGYKINDWGGISEFTLPNFENSFYLTNSNVNNLYYTGSSMRFRPEFNLKELEQGLKDNLLYHPVKRLFGNF